MDRAECVRVEINGFYNMMEMVSHGNCTLVDYSKITNSVSIRNVCKDICNRQMMSSI